MMQKTIFLITALFLFGVGILFVSLHSAVESGIYNAAGFILLALAFSVGDEEVKQ